MSVKYVKLNKYGNPEGIYCPVMTAPSFPDGGIEFVLCQGDCAWFSERNTEDGSAFFCRNDIIGFRVLSDTQEGLNNIIEGTGQ